MRWTMPFVAVSACMLLATGASPGHAQGLNDVGRLLQDQLLGGQKQPDQDAQRRAYEQGRRDSEIERRQNQPDRPNLGRRDDRDDRRYDDRRSDDRRYDDRRDTRQREQDFRYDQRPPGRY